MQKVSSLSRPFVPSRLNQPSKEMLWIYQDQSNRLDLLEDKYNVHYWNDWEVEGVPANNGDSVRLVSVMERLLRSTISLTVCWHSWRLIRGTGRNVISLWDYEAFEATAGLQPCAFQTMFDVRRVGEDIYLDATLTQRSNDMLVAHHINAMQYVALQMMIAKHFGWKVGKFFYFINNLHIYDNQFEQAEELLKRQPADCQPRLVLNVPDGTNFFDIKPEDFELVDYDPVKPQLKFDLAI